MVGKRTPNNYSKKIVSIKKIGNMQTYDLHTPKYHNFFLDNGILSHNSGKTYASLQLACLVSKALGSPFTIESNIDFTFHGLLKKMMRDENKAPGTCFVFEEVGAFGGGASAKEWQSNANKLFGSFMQTSRHRQQVLILTTPYFSFLDKSTRELVHMQLVMQNIDFQNKVAYAKPYVLQVNTRTGKIYFKLLRFMYQDKLQKLSLQGFEMPDKEMLIEYEAAKTRYTTALNNKILEAHEKKDNKQSEEAEMIEKRKEEIINFTKEGLSTIQIAVRLGVSDRTVQRYKRYWEEEQKMPSNLPNLHKKQGTVGYYTDTKSVL